MLSSPDQPLYGFQVNLRGHIQPHTHENKHMLLKEDTHRPPYLHTSTFIELSIHLHIRFVHTMVYTHIHIHIVPYAQCVS